MRSCCLVGMLLVRGTRRRSVRGRRPLRTKRAGSTISRKKIKRYVPSIYIHILSSLNKIHLRLPCSIDTIVLAFAFSFVFALSFAFDCSTSDRVKAAAVLDLLCVIVCHCTVLCCRDSLCTLCIQMSERELAWNQSAVCQVVRLVTEGTVVSSRATRLASC